MLMYIPFHIRHVYQEITAIGSLRVNMCANRLFLSLSLFLCLYTGLNEASPTPCEMSTGCPCDDIQEIVYKEGRKMESQQGAI